MKTIYLDYAASTPIDARVAAKMMHFLTDTDLCGNATAAHQYGQKARNAIEEARAQVASLLNATPSEIIWTSGATEAINLAIKGAARLYQQKGKHIITMQTEHKAVLDACQHLEKEGYRVTYLAPQANGLLAIDALMTAMCADTCLVSVMFVNNETGVIQDIAKIAAMTQQRGVLLHVDAVQAVGKLPIDLQSMPIDLLSMSAHKLYGPKGVGALYLRKKPRVRVEPLLHGGGHEQGMRSGTLPTHQLVGMGCAYTIAAAEMRANYQHVQNLRQAFVALLQEIPLFELNIPLAISSPYILNVRFKDKLADTFLQQVPHLIATTASACQRGVGSYVLRAMGFGQDMVSSAVRFSFGKPSTRTEIEAAANTLKNIFLI